VEAAVVAARQVVVAARVRLPRMPQAAEAAGAVMQADSHRQLAAVVAPAVEHRQRPLHLHLNLRSTSRLTGLICRRGATCSLKLKGLLARVQPRACGNSRSTPRDLLTESAGKLC